MQNAGKKKKIAIIAVLCIAILAVVGLLTNWFGLAKEPEAPQTTPVPSASASPNINSTPEPTPEVTPEVTPEPTPEATPEAAPAVETEEAAVSVSVEAADSVKADESVETAELVEKAESVETAEPAEKAESVETVESVETAASVEAVEAPVSGGMVAYLMYANSDWSTQYWYDGNEYPVAAANAIVTGPGAYTVGLTFDTPAEGLSFTALGIDGGEIAFPTYTIEVKAIRVNGEAIEFGKYYTSSDDGITTRVNLYNEWVSELPADARSFDGSLEGATPTPVSKDAFASVSSVEVDFVLHQFGVDTAYIMYANADWSVQYWGGEAAENVKAANAVIDGFGDYTVGLEFPEGSEGLAFSALGIVNGEKTYPGAYLKINEIRVNGEAIEVKKGYTSSDDGITTRMNLYNEWVSSLPEDARSFDGALEGASPIIVDKEAFAAVNSVEIDFTLVPVTDTAYLMFANADWSKQYWGGDAPEGVTVTNATVDGQGAYTVGLTFDEPSEGLAFAAVGITTGEQTFNGYFIDITDIKVNGESITVNAGYTSSDDGVTTRENIYNEWVSSLPDDARRADGQLEGASPMIVDKEAFTAVTSIEVSFDFIYGKPVEKNADAPLTEEEAAALQAADYNAYIGVQTENYIFRNSWDEANYGRDSEANPDFFGRLTGWDADNNAVDYGGTFVDAQLTAEGTYTVSLTTGEMGFGSDSFFRLLFVSTDVPSKLVKDGFVTFDDVQTKIGGAATQKYTDIDTSAEYVRIVVIDQYNRSADPFGYTVPGADATISITFTVTGLTD